MYSSVLLDEIDVGEVSRFRGKLLAKKLGEKRINNILLVLSKALRYALDCELIANVPKLGLFKVGRPKIVAWDFGQYARLVAAAKGQAMPVAPSVVSAIEAIFPITAAPNGVESY